MNTLREAAKQALEAMEYSGMDVGKFNRINAACQALRAALAEQPAEQEPVAWFYEERGRRWVTDALHEAQHANDGLITPLYTAPQPAKRKPLTDEEIDAVMRKALGYGLSPSRDDLDFARAIERAHGIGGGT